MVIRKNRRLRLRQTTILWQLDCQPGEEVFSFYFTSRGRNMIYNVLYEDEYLVVHKQNMYYFTMVGYLVLYVVRKNGRKYGNLGMVFSTGIGFSFRLDFFNRMELITKEQGD